MLVDDGNEPPRENLLDDGVKPPQDDLIQDIPRAHELEAEEIDPDMREPGLPRLPSNCPGEMARSGRLPRSIVAENVDTTPPIAWRVAGGGLLGPADAWENSRCKENRRSCKIDASRPTSAAWRSSLLPFPSKLEFCL